MTKSDGNEKIDPQTHEVSAWWRTSIIDMEPGKIHFRGHPIEELIGHLSFPQMIWLMLRGNIPNADEAALLEAALVASVDHGPQAPSIAVSRMAATCGNSLNNVMATAINVLGDVHGGAGEQCVELYQSIKAKMGKGIDLEQAVSEGLDLWTAKHGKFVPGFGHRFHKPVDPRSPRLLDLVDKAVTRCVVSGVYVNIARQLEQELKERKNGHAIPMNIDGATAVIFAELGFPPPLARGIFCLSRAVGILAHGWEQMEQGGRNKGPTPPEYLYKYEG